MESNNHTFAPVRKLTLVGAAVNLVLSVAKIIGGHFSGSISLVADGVHSLSDLVTDVLVLVGVWLGERPPDPSHPYGHGKFETLATISVAGVLLFAGGGIAYEAGASLYARETSFPGLTVLVLALASILAKEVLYQVTHKAANALNSQALQANAWHHRSDALSSLAVLLGYVAGQLGWGYGDQVAGIVVGLMVMGVAMNIALNSLRELTEHAAGQETTESIARILNRDPQIRGWHHLRSRRQGRGLQVDVHILVDPNMSVEASHDITLALETAIRNTFTFPVTILIHIEPDIPCYRR